MKDFYDRCLGKMPTFDNIKTFRKLLKGIMIVVLSESDRKNDDGENLESEKSGKCYFIILKHLHLMRMKK